MTLFETLITQLLVAAVLLQLARRLRMPYPTLLALTGACVAFLPWSPDLRLDPHLALVLFVAPAILDAGYDTSPHELKRDWFPLIALALFAVLLTTAAVALAGWAFAGLPVAAAVALGAIVAPPDAAAARATLAGRGLPRRTMALLQGESLLNDAVALLIFSTAVAIASAETLDPLSFTAMRLVAVPGGLLLGLVAGQAFVRLWTIWAGTLSSTILEFIAPSRSGCWRSGCTCRSSSPSWPMPWCWPGMHRCGNRRATACIPSPSGRRRCSSSTSSPSC